MSAATGYRVVARNTAAGPVLGTAWFWAQDEDPGFGNDESVGGGVITEPGTTVSTAFWVSPNIRALASWVWARSLWGVVIVSYDTSHVVSTIDTGKPDKVSVGYPTVTLRQRKISTGDIVDEFTHHELARLAIWADDTPAGELSADDILADHGVSEKGPAY